MLRFASAAARSSTPTWSIAPMRGSRCLRGSSNPEGSAGAFAITTSVGRRRALRRLSRQHADGGWRLRGLAQMARDRLLGCHGAVDRAEDCGEKVEAVDGEERAVGDRDHARGPRDVAHERDLAEGVAVPEPPD